MCIKITARQGIRCVPDNNKTLLVFTVDFKIDVYKKSIRVSGILVVDQRLSLLCWVYTFVQCHNYVQRKSGYDFT